MIFFAIRFVIAALLCMGCVTVNAQEHFYSKPITRKTPHLSVQKTEFSETSFNRQVKAASRQQKRFLKYYTKNTDTFLKSFDNHQLKLMHELCDTDERKADGLQKTFFISRPYLDKQIKSVDAGKQVATETIYNAKYDSLKTLVAFYTNCPEGFDNKKTPLLLEKLNRLLKQTEKELKRAALVKQYMRNRKNVFGFLTIDSAYATINPAAQKHYRLMKEDAFYFVVRQENENALLAENLKSKNLVKGLAKPIAQSKELKGIAVNDAMSRVNLNEFKGDALLTTLPNASSGLNAAFTSYFKNNSALSVFNSATPAVANGNNYEQALQGLQTNAQVKESLTATVKQYGSGGEEALKRGLDKGLGQLTQLKHNYTGITNAADVPDFKPKALKTVRPQQRITKSFTLQFNAAQYGVPMGADAGLKLGYLLTERLESGLGASSKAGFGQNIEHWKFTWPGWGVQSYCTYYLLATIHFYGGYERHFYNEIKLREQPAKNYSKDAALAGIEMRTNTKKGKAYGVQLLYDFLAHKNVPVTNHLIFRTNYKF